MKKKIILWIIVLFALGGGFFFLVKHSRAQKPASTITVSRHNLSETVLTTGQVKSETEIHLSFTASGKVSQMFVKEGQHVEGGQTLATLDQTNARAGVTAAQGALAEAQANKQKLIDGASSEDTAVAQSAVNSARIALDNAKQSLAQTQAQQGVAVQNALYTLFNSTLSAVSATSNSSSATPTVSGNYTSQDRGQYQVTMYSTGSNLRFTLNGLETGDGPDSTATPYPIGSRGLFIQFPASGIIAGDTWTITIPNTKASNYVTNLTAYQAAIATQSQSLSSQQSAVAAAQVALEQTQAGLALKKAHARPADVAVADAQILSAQGKLSTAEATLEDTILRAPASGTITSLDIKLGEEATALKEVIALEDVRNIHIEANVSEANVAGLATGQTVDMTLDAFGPDTHFSGTILTINPASTIISGVVDYKVTANVQRIPSFDLKPGMTANMAILVGKKENVIAIPESAIVNRDGTHKVKIVDDATKGLSHDTSVNTGTRGDGGLIEIVSGLSEGQRIFALPK